MRLQEAESELRLAAVGGLRKPPSGAEAGAEGAQAGGDPGECGLSRGTSGRVDNVEGVATFVGTTRAQWGVAEM